MESILTEHSRETSPKAKGLLMITSRQKALSSKWLPMTIPRKMYACPSGIQLDPSATQHTNQVNEPYFLMFAYKGSKQ